MNRTRRFAGSRSTQMTTLPALIALLQALVEPAASAERLRVAHSTLTATNSVLWVARTTAFFRARG